MRLSDILSKPPTTKFSQVDGFLVGKKCNIGQQITLEIGQIALNFLCEVYEDCRTFYSKGPITCICTGNSIVSIDCILTCANCPSVRVWFLVESEGDIAASSPNVRIMKRTVKLPETVEWNSHNYGVCSYLLDKANLAYDAGLGAGALVYLRKVFEIVTIQAADALNMTYQKYENGNPKNFSDLLKKVDEQSSIIPLEFASERYKLYKELSSVVHGDFSESEGLSKFQPLYRLVVGVLENIRNKQDFQNARSALGWCDEGCVLT